MNLKVRNKRKKNVLRTKGRKFKSGDKKRDKFRKNTQSGIGNKGINMTQEEMSNQQRSQTDIPERFQKQTNARKGRQTNRQAETESTK